MTGLIIETQIRLLTLHYFGDKAGGFRINVEEKAVQRNRYLALQRSRVRLTIFTMSLAFCRILSKVKFLTASVCRCDYHKSKANSPTLGGVIDAALLFALLSHWFANKLVPHFMDLMFSGRYYPNASWRVAAQQQPAEEEPKPQRHAS